MIFLKSFAAGLIAVLATAVAIAVSAIVALFLLSARNQAKDTVIGWDPVEFGRAPLAWIIFCSPSRLDSIGITAGQLLISSPCSAQFALAS